MKTNSWRYVVAVTALLLPAGAVRAAGPGVTKAKTQSKGLKTFQVSGTARDDGTLVDQHGNPYTFWVADWVSTHADCGHTDPDDKVAGDAWLGALTEAKWDHLNYKNDIKGQPRSTIELTVGTIDWAGHQVQSTADHQTVANAKTWSTSKVKKKSTGGYDVTLKAKASTYAWAKAVADSVVDPDESVAEAHARSLIGFKSKFKALDAHADVSVDVSLKNGDEKTGSKGKQSRGHRSKDPVLATVWNETTNQQVTEQLGNVTGQSNSTGGAWSSYLYDSTVGVLLEADPSHADASIIGQFSSAWLDNPYGDFGASIMSGEFNTTGAWVGLPWVLTYTDPVDPTSGVVAASLAPEYLPADLNFTTPQAYIDQGYDDAYEINLLADYQAIDVDADSIPEPASVVLLIVGMMMMPWRRIG